MDIAVAIRSSKQVFIFITGLFFVSGDLTDAKNFDGMNSRQYLKEWVHYQSTLQEAGLYNATFWLDVRGNHGDYDLETHLFVLHSSDIFLNVME